MSESSVVATFAGITFGGESSRYGVDTLDGWIGTPGVQSGSAQESTLGHGTEATGSRQGPRDVTIGGRFRSDTAAERDGLIRMLRQGLIPREPNDRSTDPLVVRTGSSIDSAEAQFRQWSLDTSDRRAWATGKPRWFARFYCPSPLIFAVDPIDSGPVPLQIQTSGRTMPFRMPGALPPQPIGGTVGVNNPGTARGGSPTVVILRGPQTGTIGVENTSTGARLVYDVKLTNSYDELRIDSERGATLNGAYRTPRYGSSPTSKIRTPPGWSQFHALGTAGFGVPTLQVIVRPASW